MTRNLHSGPPGPATASPDVLHVGHDLEGRPLAPPRAREQRCRRSVLARRRRRWIQLLDIAFAPASTWNVLLHTAPPAGPTR